MKEVKFGNDDNVAQHGTLDTKKKCVCLCGLRASLLTRRLYFQESPPVSSTAGEENTLGICDFSAKKIK